MKSRRFKSGSYEKVFSFRSGDRWSLYMCELAVGDSPCISPAANVKMLVINFLTTSAVLTNRAVVISFYR